MELHTGFYTFTSKYTFMNLPTIKSKKSMEELVLEKQLALYSLS